MKIWKTLACLAVLLTVCVHAEDNAEGTALTVYRESNELQAFRQQYGGGQQYDPATGRYVQPVPGWGVVKVRRVIPLKEGLNVVRFQDVAASIDATTVLVNSLTDPKHTSVVEQNYEYDLVSPDKILQKYIDHPLAIGSEKSEVRGELLSFDGSHLVLKTDDATNPIRIMNRGQEMRFSSLPGGLITKPTLVWQLNAKKAGDHLIQATYQTAQMAWKADYTATISSDESALDLAAWVTLTNRSGATYTDARLKLIAGDVQRILPPMQQYQRQQWDGMERKREADKAAKPQFDEKGFFEYHLYTLDRPTTLADNSEKQIELFAPVSSVPLKKIFVYYGGRGMYDYNQYNNQPNQNREYGAKSNAKVDVYLQFKNDKQAGLGLPLPAGRVRVYKRDAADKAMEFIGEDEIDHTPNGENVRLRLGSAFDLTAERRQVDFQCNYNEHWIVEKFEIKVRNHKKEDAEVRVQEDLYRWVNWEIQNPSHEFDKLTSQRVVFPLSVKAGGETVLTYTVRYTW